MLGEVIKQLSQDSFTPAGVAFRQLDALVGASLAHLRDEPPHMPRVFLDQWVGDEVERNRMLEWALEQVLTKHQEIDETYLARLLQTPFMPTILQRASLAWLGGRDLEESQIKRLGVPGPLPEERIIGALQTLGVFAAPGAPIVLVFDQLENLADSEGTGSRVRAYANLIAELFDTMRGFIIVQMALDTEWSSAIEPALSQAQRTRLMAEKQLVALPRAEETHELLKLWAEQLPDRPEPFPWPFGSRRVKQWMDTVGMTPRMLMIECRQALVEGPDDQGPEDAPPTARTNPQGMEEPWTEALEATHEGLYAAWKKHIESARKTLDEASEDRRCADIARLTGGIGCALRFVEGVRTTRVDARQPIQVELTTKDTPWAVCVVHQNHPRWAGVAIDKATEVMKAPPPRQRSMLIVRERAQEFRFTWKVALAKQVDAIRDGARWVHLEREDTAKLLALESFVAAGRSRDLEDMRGRAIEESAVLDWIRFELGVAEWAPIRFMLAMPAEESSANLDPPIGSGPVPTVSPSPKEEANGKQLNVPSTKSGTPDASVADTAATIQACLSSLRVVSLDRLTREVTRIRPRTTRAEILEVLQRTPDGVEWFGRSLLALKTKEAQR